LDLDISTLLIVLVCLLLVVIAFLITYITIIRDRGKLERDSEQLEEQLEMYKEVEERYELLLIESGIEDIDDMDGYEFENYLSVLFKKLEYEVINTPLSNDFGADLVLDGDSRGRIVVQAKRYSSPVGVKAVQEINAARDYYRAEVAWVVTNNFFTEQAKRLAESTNVVLFDR
jgi:restriction system protein